MRMHLGVRQIKHHALVLLCMCKPAHLGMLVLCCMAYRSLLRVHVRVLLYMFMPPSPLTYMCV